ncbi:hypothetical protein DFH27DRAFT_555835 [Peziza echinospora]|nr:hypothetical protein DFH27DRAFT_555835 [Peziza echinospora]
MPSPSSSPFRTPSSRQHHTSRNSPDCSPAPAPLRRAHREMSYQHPTSFEGPGSSHYGNHPPPAAPSPPVSPYPDYYDMPSPPPSQSPSPHHSSYYHPHNASWSRREVNPPAREYYQPPSGQSQPAVQSSPPTSFSTIQHLPCEVQMGIDFQLYPSANTNREQEYNYNWTVTPSNYPHYPQSTPRHPPTPESPENFDRNYLESTDVMVGQNRGWELDHNYHQGSMVRNRSETPELELGPAPEGMFPQW